MFGEEMDMGAEIVTGVEVVVVVVVVMVSPG